MLSDLNNYGVVDWSDLGIWAGYWLERVSELLADLDRNNKVDAFDYGLLGLDWGRQAVR